eukprot:CFRG4775T1
MSRVTSTAVLAALAFYATSASPLGGAEKPCLCKTSTIEFENAPSFIDYGPADNRDIPYDYGAKDGITFRIVDEDFKELTMLNGKTVRPVFERTGDRESNNGFWGKSAGAYDSITRKNSEPIGKYFLRTYSLGSAVLNKEVKHVPSLLITYTGEGTTSANGHIYDIDGNGLDEDSEYARLEQWKIVALNDKMEELGSITSPRGDWEEQAKEHKSEKDEIGNKLRKSFMANKMRTSYDSTNWMWSISAEKMENWPDCQGRKCPLSHISIQYVGVYPSGKPSSVGLAFDNFQAYGCADAPDEVEEKPEWTEWTEWKCDLVDENKCGQTGTSTRVRFMGSPNNGTDAVTETDQKPCGNATPCPECEWKEYTEFSECVYETCGEPGVKTRTRKQIDPKDCVVNGGVQTDIKSCPAQDCCFEPIDFEDATSDNEYVSLDRYKGISFRTVKNTCTYPSYNSSCDLYDEQGQQIFPEFELQGGKDSKHAFVGGSAGSRDSVVVGSVSLGDWFIRTYPLNNKWFDRNIAHVPTLLISYERYTLAASGQIYDIDGSSLDATKLNTRQEQWMITAWGTSGQVLKKILSPRGNTGALVDFHPTEKDSMGNPKRVRIKNGKEYVGYDSTNWGWAFNAATDEEWPMCGNSYCSVKDITIEFIGKYPNGHPTGVGLAFDNFDAYGCQDPTAPPPPDPPVACTYGPWSDFICSVTACGSEGKMLRTREVNYDGECVLVDPYVIDQGDDCVVDDCVCELSPWSGWVCSVNGDCGQTGIQTRSRTVINIDGCVAPDKDLTQIKIINDAPAQCQTDLCVCELTEWTEYECNADVCGTTGESISERGYIANVDCRTNENPEGGFSRSNGTCYAAPCPCQPGEWSNWSCNIDGEGCGLFGVSIRTREIENPSSCNSTGIPLIEEGSDICSTPACCVVSEWTDYACNVEGCGLEGQLVSTRFVNRSIPDCELRAEDANVADNESRGTEKCFTELCNCAPSAWSEWECSADVALCGAKGTRSRQRTYSNVDNCTVPDVSTETEDNRYIESQDGGVCETKCCVFTMWTEYCSAQECSEESGVIVKTRNYIGGRGCAIPDEDAFKQVTDTVCTVPVDEFTSWSECNATECDVVGMRERFVCGDNTTSTQREEKNCYKCKSKCKVQPWSEWNQVSSCNFTSTEVSCLRADRTNVTIHFENATLIDSQNEEEDAASSCFAMCEENGPQTCTGNNQTNINFNRHREITTYTGNAKCPSLDEMCLCPCTAADGDDNTPLIAGLASAGAAVLLAAAGAAVYFTKSAATAQASAGSADLFNDVANAQNPLYTPNIIETNNAAFVAPS